MRRFFLLCGLLVLAGCSSNSFLGRRADNFTAYYNTFYNAQASFDEGVRSLEQRRETRLDRTRYLSLFPQPPPGGNQQFEKAIVKSADVLRKHPDSKWADDALLLIGKSYFYTGQYVGAEQKFREIIYELAEQRGAPSPLDAEARFWLARTLVNNEAYDRAESFLEETLAQEDVARNWEGRYRLVQGELFVQQGRWDEAAEALHAGIDAVRDRDLRARAYLLLGQVEETRGQYREAVAAYRSVDRYKPTYDLLYAAQLSAIRVEGQHGDADAALADLRRMERDGKNYEFRNEIRYVRGLILQAAGQPGEAFGVYDDVLYGGDGDISTLRGPLHYAIATLYRDVYDDYFLAAAHFDTAATAFGTPAAPDEFLTPEAIVDAPEMKATFGAFAGAMAEIQEADSLLALGMLPPDAFAARIREIREQKARELAEQQREIERRNAQRAFGGDAGRLGAATDVQAPASAGGMDATQAGFLAHRDPVRLRENRQAFLELWGDRPLVDNWRRSASITGTERVELAASLDADADGLGNGLGSEVDALPQVDLSMIPRTVETQAQMRTRRAEARYRLGNVLFLNMNRPDSAAAWYRYVIEEDGEEEVAPRAYYALAEVQQALGDTLAASALFRETLSAYPDSDFADRIRERLGLSQEAAPDSSALAAAAYERARARWLAGAYAPALDSLLAIPARYSATPEAPKALYAAGMLFLEWASRDSLDVLDTPLPASTRRLVEAGLIAPGDTLAFLPADTTQAPPDVEEAEPEAPPAPDGQPEVYAVDLFRHLQQAYAGTPYAEQAVPLTEALEAREAARQEEARLAAEAAAALEETEEGDEADEPMRERFENVEDAPPFRTSTDSSRVQQEEEPLQEDASDTPGPDTALRGTEPVLPGADGYTIIVGEVASEEGAAAIAASYQRLGYRVGVLPGTGEEGAVFRVGVGQFASAAEARQALAGLGSLVPESAWVLKL